MKKQTFLIAAILIFAVSFSTHANKRAGRNVQQTNVPVIDMKQLSSEELRQIAQESRKNSDYRTLAAALTARAAIETRNFDIRIELGDVLLADNKFQDAVRALNEASALIPSDAAPHKLLAQVYNKMGDDAKRYSHLKQASTLGVNSWENQFMLAQYYSEKGMSEKAEASFNRATELNPEAAVSKFEHGKMLLNNDDAEGAFRKFSDALLLEPNNAHFLAFHAYSAALTKREGMVDGIKTALKSAPRDGQVLYLSAMIHTVYGSTATAKKELQTALGINANDFQAMEALADLLVTEMKFKEACKYYLTVMEKAGFSEQRAYKLGKALALDMKLKEAVIFLESASKVNNSDKILHRLIDTYCNLGDLKQAQAALGRFGANRSIEWFQAAAGRVYEAQNEPYLAWIAYTTSNRFNENNPHVNAGFARILAARNEYDSALTFFELAYEMDSLNIQIPMNMAKVYELKGDSEKVLNVYENVLAKYPEHPDLYMTVATMKAQRGDYKGAIECLAAALLIRPNDTKINFMLGQMYQAANYHELAISSYQASLKVRGSQNIEALRLIGNIYYSKLSNEKKAREFFRRYARAGGRNSEVDEIMSKIDGKKRI
ncbi:MAG: tetratricopeptide repeat protein [Chitinispirillia bacterium]|nr:tetratricopeptide repeat protein [Chitinispirillia bacterium]